MDEESVLEALADEEFTTALPSNETSYTLDWNSRIVLGVIYSLTVVVGIVGNVFVIVAVGLSRRLQTAMNTFVVNLAFADLLACLTFVTQAVTLLGQEVPVGICVATAVTNSTSLGCSLSTLTMIAINRYILITKPKHIYQLVYTPLNMALMIVAAWLIAPICMIIASKKICGVFIVKHSAPWVSWLVPLLLIGSLVTILISYILIFLHIRRHVARSMVSQPSSKRLDISITKNLLYVVCAFYACVLPYTLTVIIAKFTSNPKAFYPILTVFIVILNMNSVINPIIYALRHPIFKPIFGHMIRCQYAQIPEPSNFLKAVVKVDSKGPGIDKTASVSGKTEESDIL